MALQLRGSIQTLLEPPEEAGGENHEHDGKDGRVRYESIWQSLPRNVPVKPNVHVPRHHDTTKVPTCTKYNLLQCKELKLMCRKKGLFVAQVLLPILIVVILNFRTIVLKSEVEPTMYTPFVLAPVQMKWCNETILFSPNSMLVRKVVDQIRRTSSASSNLKFAMHPNPEQQISKTIGDTCGTVHFTGQAMKNDSREAVLPNIINYQIRLRAVQGSQGQSTKNSFYSEQSRWATDSVFAHDLVVGPRNKYDNEGGSPGYASEGFLYLQSRIDQTLTSMVYKYETGLDYGNPYYFQLERFPFPAFESTNMVYLIQFELPLVLILAFLVQILLTTYLAVKEKEAGAKEFLKSYGISNFLQWMPFIVKDMIQYALVNIAITLLLCSRWYPDGKSHTAIIDDSSPSLIFVILQFVAFNTCATSCLISVFFANAKYAACTAGFYWIFLNLPFVYFNLHNFTQNPLYLKYISSLFAQIGMRTALQFVAVAEANVEGAHWLEIFDGDFGIGHVLAMLFTGGVISILLAVYIENVAPTSINTHSHPIPHLYFLHGWWWKGRLPPDTGDAPEDYEGPASPENFELEPTYLKLEFQVKGLSKCYPGDVGIFNATMNFYEGEITVILGLQGSGKSTFYGLICGFISPTRGGIFLNNVNIRTEARYIKYNLGSCPQENFLYDYLTVEEHISLYAQLKGFQSMADAWEETSTLIKELKLKSVRSKMASTLNYSQKRLVHIAIALCAGSKVVILDQPTAGVDISTKRIIWKAIQQEKKHRTIIIFSTDTEETNFTADRVAILVNGEVQCRGSLSFIKSKFGGGYHLKLVKGSRFKHFDVTNLVKVEVAHSQVANETEEFITYFLPGEYAPQFPLLLQQLEQRTTSYDIEDISISYVTMEEVFKKVCMADETEVKIEFKRRHTVIDDFNADADADADNVQERVIISNEQQADKVTNFFLQLWYLLLKNMRVTWRNISWFFFPYAIGILLIIMVSLIIRTKPFDKNYPSLGINLKELKKFSNPKILLQCEEQYNGFDFCQLVNNIAKKYAQVQEVDERDIDRKIQDLVLDTYRRKRSLAQSDLVMAVHLAHGSSRGITTLLTVLFDNQPLHIPPVAVNFASNLMLTDALNSSTTRKTRDDYVITTENFPLEYQTIETLELADDHLSSGYYLGLTLTWAMTFFIPILIVFPIREKYFKHIQSICGVNIFLYWFTNVFWDLIIYTIFSISIMVVLYLFEIFQLIGKHIEEVSSDFQKLILLFQLYGFTSIGLVHCMVPLFKRSGLNGYFYTWLVFFFTGPFPLSCVLITTEQYRDSTSAISLSAILLEALLIFPSCSFGLGVFNVYARYRYDSECTEQEQELVCHKDNTHACCVKDDFFHYNGGFGIGENVIALAAIGFISHLLTLFLETDTSRVIKLWFRNTTIGNVCCFEKKRKVRIIDEDPLPEIDFGDSTSVNSVNEDDEKYEIILTNIFHQTPKGQVLLDIPKLRLKKQECTCVFGLGGSGKEILLQILAGIILPDMGDVTINKNSLLRNYSEYLKEISYSPHHATLLPELTGRETLSLCAILSRVASNKMESVITALCIKLNLLNSLENRVGEFSAGTLKKLAIAIAIINNPEILIFEEPSMDVDPLSRAQILRALSDLKKTSSILISTSDMEICEQIADRVIVFGRSNGRIRCYGSPMYLRKTYCDNNTITATLIPDTPEKYTAGNIVQLGWDYDKETEPLVEIKVEPGDDDIPPRSKSHNEFLNPILARQESNQHLNLKGAMKPGISKDKVRFVPRTQDTQPSPSPSMPEIRSAAAATGPRFSILSTKNRVHPDGIERSSPSSPQIHNRHNSMFGPKLSMFAPKMSIFGSLFNRNAPKYEYESSTSSSDTFVSTTAMEHWQMELIPIINFIETQFPDSELINVSPCFVQYLLKTEVRLSEIFQKMAIAKEYLDLEHYSIGEMTLEQFFLHYIS